jgi:hypothetical protein
MKRQYETISIMPVSKAVIPLLPAFIVHINYILLSYFLRILFGVCSECVRSVFEVCSRRAYIDKILKK